MILFLQKKIMKSVLFPVVILCLSGMTSLAQVTIQDSLALVSFYHATGGEQWTNNTQWLNGPVAQWYGITLNGNRVSQIKLDDNGLKGYIPESIGTLTGLVEISIGNADYEGGIPESLGQLSALYSLNIRRSGLTGPIPSALGNCNQLTQLNLSGNLLEGSVPGTLAQCQLLYSIQLQDNQLSGPFPSLFLTLPLLRSLDISKNQFTGGIPPEINEINMLTSLGLAENFFEGPFPRIDHLTLLEGLYIEGNSFSGDLDTVLGFYPEMKNLYIHDNQFTGRLSPDHFVPEKMIRIWAFNNQLSSLGVFADWVNQTGFNQVYVSHNNLDFDDLLPNSSMPSNKFLCAPQNPIGTDTTISLLPGEAYTIFSPMQDEDILYQWYFNNELINGVENFDLIIDPFTPQLAGEYFFTAAHLALPGVELVSATTTLAEATTSVAKMDQYCLQLYPNPTADRIVLVADPGLIPYQVQLFAADGHLLFTTDVSTDQISLSLRDYPAGMYILKSEGPAGNRFNRVVKL
jgi:hypothetical protein